MSKALGTLIALVGVVVSCLSFYYSRHEDRIEKRPVLDITEAYLLSRENVNGNEFDQVQLTIANHGARISSPTVAASRDYVGAGDLDDIGEVAPNQSINKTLTTKFDASTLKGKQIRFAIELKYGDRTEPSHSFSDEIQLCAPTLIGSPPPVTLDHPSSTSLESSAAPFPEYSLQPPEALHRCGAQDFGWWDRQ
jgi:hypothetical protein